MNGVKLRQGMVWLLLVLLLAGCTSKPTAPNYYTLVPNLLDGAAAIEVSSSIGLWPIELPDLLDRSGIVSYQQQHRVNISNQNIWAGDLAENIGWVIGQDLSQQLGLSQFWYYPWESREKPDYELRIRIDTMAGPLAGPLAFEARVTLRDNKKSVMLLNQRIAFQQEVSSQDHDAYVAAINKILQRFSTELAQRIQRSVPAFTQPQ